MKEVRPDHHPPNTHTAYTVVTSNWLLDLRMKGKETKLFEDNLGEYVYDLRIGKDCLNRTSKILIIKKNSGNYS